MGHSGRVIATKHFTVNTPTEVQRWRWSQERRKEFCSLTYNYLAMLPNIQFQCPSSLGLWKSEIRLENFSHLMKMATCLHNPYEESTKPDMEIYIQDGTWHGAAARDWCGRLGAFKVIRYVPPWTVRQPLLSIVWFMVSRPLSSYSDWNENCRILTQHTI